MHEVRIKDELSHLSHLTERSHSLIGRIKGGPGRFTGSTGAMAGALGGLLVVALVEPGGVRKIGQDQPTSAASVHISEYSQILKSLDWLKRKSQETPILYIYILYK